MMKEFYNNNGAITFYFISIICMAIANLVSSSNYYIYLTLIVFGIIFFGLGLSKRFSKK